MHTLKDQTSVIQHSKHNMLHIIQRLRIPRRIDKCSETMFSTSYPSFQVTFQNKQWKQKDTNHTIRDSLSSSQLPHRLRRRQPHYRRQSTVLTSRPAWRTLPTGRCCCFGCYCYSLGLYFCNHCGRYCRRLSAAQTCRRCCVV